MIDGRRESDLFASGMKTVAGLDEVGRGPLAGPVVAACVMLESDFAYRDTYGVIKDSKAMSEKNREKAFDLIKQEFRYIGIGICSPAEIDQMNILQASLLAMKKAYQSIGKGADCLLIDGNQGIVDLSERQETIIKGDSNVLCIAAASIIAKVTRDKMMDEYDSLYPGYGFAKHKGYGTKLHMEAIRELGICPIHRRSFSPCR